MKQSTQVTTGNCKRELRGECSAQNSHATIEFEANYKKFAELAEVRNVWRVEECAHSLDAIEDETMDGAQDTHDIAIHHNISKCACVKRC